MSFAKLIQLFKDPEPPTPGHDPVRLATAAVLLDIAYADGEFHPNESGDLVDYLRTVFSLGPDDAQELVEAAHEIRTHTIDHFALTHAIRKNTTLEQRVAIVRAMWRMVYADGRLTDYEGYLVRKLADLLGLEHRLMIDTKVGVLRELEAG